MKEKTMKYHYGDLLSLVNDSTKFDHNSILTGATGFLGGHYLFWRLQLPGKTYALVRAENQQHARDRVMATLKITAASYNLPLPDEAIIAEKLHCMVVEISAINCGLSSQNIALLQQASITEIWHIAADLSFREKHRERIFNTNVQGSKNLLQLATTLSIPRFNYVSTAYTSGTQSGHIQEVMHPHDQKFTNYYEESKFCAEYAVKQYCTAHALAWTIVRPTMIMGPIFSKRSGGTRFGIYGLAQDLFNIKSTLSQMHTALFLHGKQGCTGNLVPVDYVVFDMLYLTEIDYGDKNIYHASASNTIKLQDILASIERQIGTNCLQLVETMPETTSALQALFNHKAAFYTCYTQVDKLFERSLPSNKPVSLADLESYMQCYIDELTHENQSNNFQQQCITTFDSNRLCVHTLGDAASPPVVIVNAYAMPVDFVTPLARWLAKTFFVITWDTRWVPGLTHEFVEADCHSGTHANDLLCILNALNIKTAALVGWSSGVQVSLRMMHEYPERVSAAVLLNGGTSLKLAQDASITNYEKNIKSLLPKIASNKRMATLYCDLIYGVGNQLTKEDEQSVSAILTSIDPHLLHMTSMPFRNPESLYRYACMMSNLFSEQDDAYTSNNNKPILVYGSALDEVTHPDVARGLHKALSNSQLFIADNFGHFSFFEEKAVADTLAGFLYEQVMAIENVDA